jgi:hypothetical protein
LRPQPIGCGLTIGTTVPLEASDMAATPRRILIVANRTAEITELRARVEQLERER